LDSLDALGEWFRRHVEVCPRSSEEMKNIRDKLAFPIEFPNLELTDKTLSIFMDIGIYLGQVLRKNHPALHWEQIINNKRFVDYGYPVLVGFTNAPLNPIRIVNVLAHSIANKTHMGKRLREVHNIWSNLVQPAA
jgi:hypothetical protein